MGLQITILLLTVLADAPVIITKSQCQEVFILVQVNSIHSDTSICGCPSKGFGWKDQLPGRKLLRIGKKYDFHGLLACAGTKDTTPPNFAEKTFAATKLQNSRKLSPSKVSCYMVLFFHHTNLARNKLHSLVAFSRHCS